MLRPIVFPIIGLLLLLFAVSTAVEPGGPSFQDVADQAYADRDWAKAAEYYGKWVQAEPSDQNAWYNWACCLALNGQAKEAAKTLLYAVEAGWRGRPHTERDPDLNSIRNQPDYLKALEKIDELLAKDSGDKSISGLYARQTRMAPYWIRLPSDYNPEKSYPLVLLLHGRGGNPRRFIQIAEKMDTVNFIYAAPQAPYYVNDSKSGFQYYPSVSSEDSVTYVDGAEQMAEWVIQVFKDISNRFKLSESRFWIVGFSQGANAAHLVGLLRPDAVAGYAALGGYLPEKFVTTERLEKMKKKNVKVFIGHGSEDQVVAPSEAQKAIDTLLDYDINVIHKTYASGHTISDAMRLDVIAWLQRNCLK